MIREIEHSQIDVARRVADIQRAAYAIEAALIGFDGIPQLHETATHVLALHDLEWRGAFDGPELVGVIAWRWDGSVYDIDRLAVDPGSSRRGHGRRLVRSVPPDRAASVSTGAGNEPAIRLYLGEGFVEDGATRVAPGVLLAHFSRPSPGQAGHTGFPRTQVPITPAD